MRKFLQDSKAIVLDLDYTIFDEASYFKEVFTRFCSTIGAEEKLEVLCNYYYLLRPKSKNIFKEILTEIGEEKNIDILFELYTNTDCSILPYSDVLPFIEEVKKYKIKLGILSNGNTKAQANKVRNLNIGQYFDSIVYARMFGAEREKPDIAAFEYIRDQFKVKDQETIVFIGDNPKTDFKGAKITGGITVRVRRGLYASQPSDEYVDHEVDSLEELI